MSMWELAFIADPTNARACVSIVEIDIFGLCELEQAIDAGHASHAALFIAADLHFGIEAVIGIDPDRPGLDGAREPPGALQIIGPYCRREAIGCRVGQLDGFRVASEGLDDQD